MDKEKNIQISPAFARIHAHICGDGYITKSTPRRTKKELIQHPRKNLFKKRYHIAYVNKNKYLVEQYKKDIKMVFNLKVRDRTKKHEYWIDGKWVYNIMSNNGALKSHNWYIPKKIVSSNRETKANWLSAFFDDEGYVYRNTVYLDIVNEKGIKQIIGLLSKFKVKSKLLGPYYYKNKKFRPRYRIKVLKESVNNFYKYINFYHPRKRKELEIIIKNGAAGI